MSRTYRHRHVRSKITLKFVDSNLTQYKNVIYSLNGQFVAHNILECECLHVGKSIISLNDDDYVDHIDCIVNYLYDEHLSSYLAWRLRVAVIKLIEQVSNEIGHKQQVANKYDCADYRYKHHQHRDWSSVDRQYKLMLNNMIKTGYFDEDGIRYNRRKYTRD